MRKICVFCGSSTGKNPVYSDTAVRLGEYFVKNSLSLIYGGGDVGLMGILSSTVMLGGGHVTGIIPEKIHRHVPHKNITELIVVKTMHERKALMYSRSEAFICLPGGIGSLDELLEVFTWQQLGYHAKPVLLLNINGYYNFLIKQLKLMVTEGFLKESHLSSLIVKENIDNLIDELFTTDIQHHNNKW
jgi:hypothetical protein